MKAQQIPKVVREALAERSGSTCEVCGIRRAVQAHHRRPRGMGGSRDAVTNSLANLLHLCLMDHLAIEAGREKSYSYGWLCRQSMDPGKMPAYMWHDARLSWVHLSDDGGVSPISDVELVALSQLLGFGVVA